MRRAGITAGCRPERFTYRRKATATVAPEQLNNVGRVGRWQDGVVELREVLRLDPDNAGAAKALYIANEQAKAQLADVRRPL